MLAAAPMDLATMTYERAGGIARITLDRPERSGYVPAEDPRRSRAEAAGAPPLGVVLAGGAASRFPEKVALILPRAVAALRAVLPEVVVAAKAEVQLPEMGVRVWREPPEPRHPLFGVGWALMRAERPVLALAGDMPSPDPRVLRALAGDRGSAPVVVPLHPGGSEPLCALYRPAARRALFDGAEAGTPARAIVAALGPDWLELEDDAAFANINRPEDLA